MNPAGLLPDENAPHAIRDRLLRCFPDLRVPVIGGEAGPPLGSSDPDIIRWLDQEGCCLVTYNRATIPDHLGSHVMGGGHPIGIFAVRPNATIGEVIRELTAIWTDQVWTPYADKVTYIPRRGYSR